MKYFIANWKMSLGTKEVTDWVEKFSQKHLQAKNKVIIVAPSFAHLPLVDKAKNGLGVELASQDVAEYDKGAHTGEVGSFQIKEFCHYSIVGHSERKESQEVVTKKTEQCLNEGLVPIVCFVKPEQAVMLYREGAFMSWEDPNNISKNGEYRDKDPQEIKSGVEEIRKLLPKDLVLIYGGSVNRNNIKTLNQISGIDGVLVGNASLDPNHFADIISSCL
jgi:triosephosphate isomerase (TIM)